MRRGNILLIILVAVGILAASLGGYFWWTSPVNLSVGKAGAVDKQNRPLTWNDCLKIPGAFIPQSYPVICNLPDGRSAAQPHPELGDGSTPTSTVKKANGAKTYIDKVFNFQFTVPAYFHDGDFIKDWTYWQPDPQERYKTLFADKNRSFTTPDGSAMPQQIDLQIIRNGILDEWPKNDSYAMSYKIIDSSPISYNGWNGKFFVALMPVMTSYSYADPIDGLVIKLKSDLLVIKIQHWKENQIEADNLIRQIKDSLKFL